MSISDLSGLTKSSFLNKSQNTISVLNEKRVLVIYVSGAIGAEYEVEKDKTRILKGKLLERIKGNSYFCDLEYTQQHQEDEFLVTPIYQNRRTVYKVIEMDPIQNSRQTTFEEVKLVGQVIKENYQEYNAFVLLCGLATITYVGSILSFYLENLAKPVILTGALIPLSFMRNDAFQNIQNSLLLGGHYMIPEVLIVMDRFAYRANRCRQLDSSKFESIESPNFPPLVDFNINVEVQWQYVLRKTEAAGKLQLSPDLVTDILIVKITPFMNIDHYKHVFYTPGLRCCILECYHFGELPHSEGLMALLRRVETERDLIVIAITQCIYATSKKDDQLQNSAVIVRCDITPESALAKVGYLLGKGYNTAEVKRRFQSNIQGETQSIQQQERFEGKRQHFIQTLSESLQKNTGDEQLARFMQFMNRYGIPNLACYMAKTGQLQLLRELKDFGDLNTADFDQRNVLHLATAENQMPIIKFLIEELNVDINPIDYLGYSPMFDALQTKNKTLLFYFKQKGGVIHAPHDVLVDFVLNIGNRDDLEMLECLFYSGVKNLNEFYDCDDRNIAHIAVFAGSLNVLHFLKTKAHFDFGDRDRWGHSPLDEAMRILHKQYEIQVEKINDIVSLLKDVQD